MFIILDFMRVFYENFQRFSVSFFNFRWRAYIRIYVYIFTYRYFQGLFFELFWFSLGIVLFVWEFFAKGGEQNYQGLTYNFIVLGVQVERYFQSQYRLVVLGKGFSVLQLIDSLGVYSGDREVSLGGAFSIFLYLGLVQRFLKGEGV